jgi:transcriptional regulator with XRE-family HTH domain
MDYYSSCKEVTDMFGENLKILRQEKGMSQEILAQKLNIVRQTVSKWEKGLSVPDAEMLVDIAELFEVPVSELLGVKINNEKEINEVAAQLALLNEQLAGKSRHGRKIWKRVLITIGVILVAGIVLMILLTMM